MKTKDIIKEYKTTRNNFEEIEKEYKKLIYKVIYTTTTEREREVLGIEDLYQECLIILYKCLQKFKTNSEASFKTYLYKSLKNNLFNIKTSKTLKFQLTEGFNTDIIQEEKVEKSSEEVALNRIFFKDLNKSLKTILFTSEIEQVLYELRFVQNWELRFIQEYLMHKYNYKFSISWICLRCQKIVDKTQKNLQFFVEHGGPFLM